jgi:aryl-alcohol dehydrogenase-like predicted oxidoreductase
MKYAQLGKNCGLTVSRLSFGAMTLGEGPLAGNLHTRIGQAEADKMVHTAIEYGVNLFDTADMYTGGQSETILGKALGKKRGDVILATKCGFRSAEPITSAGLSRLQIINCVQASLARLGTDYIDLFQLHIPDPRTPLEETASALEYVVSKGMVRYVGYCNYPAWKAQKLISIQQRRGYSQMISAQMYYSLLGRDVEQGTAQFLADSGLGLLVWSPLAGGFLSGKYTRENPVPPGSRREKFDFPPVDKEKGYAVAERLGKIAGSRGASSAAAAIAWLLAKPFVTSVIVGANNMDQLVSNLKSADLTLTKEETAELDAVSQEKTLYPHWMEPMGDDAKIKAALEA